VLTAAASPPPAAAPTAVKPSSEAKKIDLVTVEDGWGETDTSSPPAPAPNTVIPAPVTLSAVAAPPSGKHDLQEEVAPTPSSSSPMQAGKDTAAEVSSGGAYAVQLASERSAAEAHASFRALRSKFPNQLGGREPIVRRTKWLPATPPRFDFPSRAFRKATLTCAGKRSAHHRRR
jgi:hypothetical protein